MTRKSPINCEDVSGCKNEVFAVRKKSSFRFRREEHLKRRNEIREVFEKGRWYSCRGAKLFTLKNDLPYNRICFSLSKGFGSAVARNRARRLGREAYRLLRSHLAGSHDLILLIYPNAEELSLGLSGRIRQVEFLFKKAGLLE